MLVYEIWRIEDQEFLKTFGVDDPSINFVQKGKWKLYQVKFRLGQRSQFNTTKSMKLTLEAGIIPLGKTDLK